MVSRYLPMLARPASAPFDSDDWLFEIKWDGVRAIATVDGKLSLRSRNDTELAGQFPETYGAPSSGTRHGARWGDCSDYRREARYTDTPPPASGRVCPMLAQRR